MAAKSVGSTKGETRRFRARPPPVSPIYTPASPPPALPLSAPLALSPSALISPPRYLVDFSGLFYFSATSLSDTTTPARPHFCIGALPLSKRNGAKPKMCCYKKRKAKRRVEMRAEPADGRMGWRAPGPEGTRWARGRPAPRDGGVLDWMVGGESVRAWLDPAAHAGRMGFRFPFGSAGGRC